jgi:large-conductance mechanosensitive channel
MLKDFLKIEKWHGKNAWQPLALCEILGQPPTYSMLKDFKEFAFKGNLIDMAVGIIIGGAFGTVVKSLVDNVFMPVLGKLTGGINFTEQYVNLNFPTGPKIPYAQALKAGEPVIGFGQFCTDLKKAGIGLRRKICATRAVWLAHALLIPDQSVFL